MSAREPAGRRGWDGRVLRVDFSHMITKRGGASLMGWRNRLDRPTKEGGRGSRQKTRMGPLRIQDDFFLRQSGPGKGKNGTLGTCAFGGGNSIAEERDVERSHR